MTLTKDLDEQIAKNRVTSIAIPWENFLFFLLRLVLKPNSSWRRIYHESFPKGLLVNRYISEKWGSLKYTTFDKAIEAILRSGPNSVMVKKDLADAFC